MARPRVAWWSQSPVKWAFQCVTWVWVKKSGICCPSIPRTSSIRYSPDSFREKMPSKKTVKRESSKPSGKALVRPSSSSNREKDEAFLRRALELAREGIGLASPNPCVGAVVVDSKGRVAGEGLHTFAGIKHAEILALEQAGEKARGGVLYINLEPCSHQARP